MTWYYWVLTCWIGLNMLMIPWFWALGLLVSKRAGCNSIRPIRAPSPVSTRLGGEKTLEEKRKSKRFKGKDGAFAAFIRPNELMSMGQIQDISLGGLCVRYLSGNEDNIGCSEIKIFGSNGRFIHLDRIQCRIVYDHQVLEGSWGEISMRRSGVQFENLSVEHLSVLPDFIDYFCF
jgi:hypothetical protein